jgi:uncharacterized membrane protein (DUF4010 family)
MIELPPLVHLVGFAVALGLGLLIGIERERSKGEGPTRGAAGVRTFTLVALIGALAAHMGPALLLLAGGFIGLAALFSYARSHQDDPGLTTEIAMLATLLLGALAQTEPGLAAALSVVVAILLHAKSRLHEFSQTLLTPQEVHDGLLLLASALIVLPLLPAGTIDPWGVIEIRKLWTIVVAIMAIGAAGHVALRLAGPRVGLPLAGFIGGFVSSAATIAAMGQRATRDSRHLSACAAAGMASSITTALLMGILLAGVSMPLLRAVWPMLVAGGMVALAATWALARAGGPPPRDDNQPGGRPFDPKEALIFAVLLAGILLISAGLKAWLGPKGIWIAAATAGLADAHAATLSMGQLVAGGSLEIGDARWALVLAFSANLLTKLTLAARAGKAYFVKILPGHLAMLAAVAGLATWGALRG